jgi:hypothetical protein
MWNYLSICNERGDTIMADAKTPSPAGGTTNDATGAKTAAKTLGLRLNPVANSDQPIVANVCNVHLAPGMAYIDFGFIEPGVLAALPRMVQQGDKMPEQVNGKLAVRVVMAFDGLANLQQQLTRVMEDLAKAAKAQTTARDSLLKP